AADLVAAVLGEPEGAVRPGRDAERQTAESGTGELGNSPCGDKALSQLLDPGLPRPRNRTRSPAALGPGTVPGPQGETQTAQRAGEQGEPTRCRHEPAPGWWGVAAGPSRGRRTFARDAVLGPGGGSAGVAPRRLRSGGRRSRAAASAA